MMKRFAGITVLFFCLALVVACAGDKGPAEMAIKAAEEALNSVKAEAAKYVPDQLKKVDDALKAAKDSFAKGDYKAALEGSKDLAAKAKDLAAAASAKKAELTKSWEELSADIPKATDELKARIDSLSKAKKLPAGVEKSAVETAKAGYNEAVKAAGEASEAFKTGNVPDAVAKAKAIKDKIAELMASLAGQAQAAKKQSNPVSVGLAATKEEPQKQPAKPVDLNTASQADLESLKGAGPATAKKIIANRSYKTVDGLSKAGLSKKQIESLRTSVGAAPQAAAPKEGPKAAPAPQRPRRKPLHQGRLRSLRKAQQEGGGAQTRARPEEQHQYGKQDRSPDAA